MNKIKYVFFATLALALMAIPAMAQRLRLTTNLQSAQRKRSAVESVSDWLPDCWYRTGTRRFACG